MILGIDLGTTKSVAGIWHEGKARIIPDSAGNLSIPSLVLVTQDQKICVGRKAQNHPQKYSGKNITISSIKRLTGKRGETGWGWWKTYPQEVSAFILSELRSQSEKYLGQKITDAVISIPSHFDESQRRATKEAANIAGLNVLRLMNEATAALLSYGENPRNRERDQNVVVFDLGGGTLDICVATIGAGVYEVKCVEGDSNLGGDDFTQVIEDYVLSTIQKEHGKSIELDQVQKMLLREASENAKIELSSGQTANISFPGFLRIGTKFCDLSLSVDRPTFESLSKHLFDRCIDLLNKAITSSKLSPSDIDALLLLGMSSHIPHVRTIILQDLKEHRRHSLFKKGRSRGLRVDPFKGADPEICVAEGAIIQSAVFSGDVKDVLLLEALPCSYGVRLEEDEFSVILAKNTCPPKKHSKIFTTSRPNQRSITLDIFQGESKKASENNFLNTIELSNILPAEAGVPQIEVTFDVDANMIVNVSARDLATGSKWGQA